MGYKQVRLAPEGSGSERRPVLIYCCRTFCEEVEKKRFRHQEAGNWAIKGCDDVTWCYVVSEMRYCPFCGEKLSAAEWG